MSKYLDPIIRTNNASFWNITVRHRYKDKGRNHFDNINTIELHNYRNTGLTAEAVKINSDTGELEP